MLHQFLSSVHVSYSCFCGADALRVVTQNPKIRGRSLVINLMDTSLDATTKTCAIEVKDVHPSISEDQLALYFESERRSGGGDIEDLEFDRCRRMAVITFKTPEGII